MINIRKKYFILTLLTFFSGCIEPDSEYLWSISVDKTLYTESFVRDIEINGNHAFIAAGQSGFQIWDLSSGELLNKFDRYIGASGLTEFQDISLVGRDSINNLIFLSETNKRVLIFEYDGIDSLFYIDGIMSDRTKDFISFSSDSGYFTMFSADNDDGLLWGKYEKNSLYDTYYIYQMEGEEIYSPGKPEGIDSDGSGFIALAVDQLGVELYSLDSIGLNPMLVGKVDTEGNAENVLLTSEGIFASCDDAGAYFISIESFTSNNLQSFRFAVDFTVDHIAIDESKDIAALSIGSKGIALYDISDKENPKERGVFSIGYTYKSHFWNDYLIVCSREGIQMLTITK